MMTSRQKTNARMRELILKVIAESPKGRLLKAKEMCKTLESLDSRISPFPLRVTNLIRGCDGVRYDRKLGGYVVE